MESFDDRIDPVGACVGIKGSRIHGIVKELHNESIDVMRYSANREIFIERALAPARILRLEYSEEENRVQVFLEPEQVSMAIGKGGLNIKLASMLTGCTIDVFRDMPQGVDDIDDIYLDEFNDEVDQWVIDAVKALGYETAREVLAAPARRSSKRPTSKNPPWTTSSPCSAANLKTTKRKPPQPSLKPPPKKPLPKSRPRVNN